ncbi:MAG: ribosome recycling factor [Spirochaeta sp.]|jgi:ribosome recycling factor|nr:ribosome recycling factor [Spirochaeta sp.]
MDAILKDAEERMGKSLASLEEELAGLRTGRASAAMFDKIRVEYFGNPSPLNQVASISVPESRLVVIQPWDKGLLGEIEKAIQSSELSLNPNKDGKVSRINIPPLTEERRKEIVKLAKNIAEQGRIAVRNIRRDANEELKKSEKNGDISEDDLKRSEERVQKLTDQFIEKINETVTAKESEILEI